MNRKEWINFQREMYAKGREFGETTRSLDTGRFKWVRERIGNPPATVLDVGCNDGAFTKELAGRGFKVTGLDFPEAIERIGEIPGVSLIATELDDLMLYTYPRSLAYIHRYDVILAVEILEHLIYDFDFLRWCRDALKEGGRLFITVPKEDHNCQPGDHHLRFYTYNSLLKLLYVAGFGPAKWNSGDADSLMVEAVVA